MYIRLPYSIPTPSVHPHKTPAFRILSYVA